MSLEENWPKQEEQDHGHKQDDGGQQQVTQQKRKNKKRVINNPKQSTGHWSESEHKTYLEFLNAHRPIMESQDQKKTSKIFKLMSEIIGTRSPSQCRSHHQKFNPFVHQIKKRQKGAGRKKKDPAVQQEKHEYTRPQFEQSVVHQFFIPPPFYQQPIVREDYSMLAAAQYPMNPMIYPPIFEGMQKDDEKQVEQMYFPYMMPQIPTEDNKNMYPYGFGLFPQQVQLNFNYYPQHDMLAQAIKEDQYGEEQ